MGEVLKFKLNLNLRTFWETFDFWGYHRFSLGFQKKWQIGFIFFRSSLKNNVFLIVTSQSTVNLFTDLINLNLF